MTSQLAYYGCSAMSRWTTEEDVMNDNFIKAVQEMTDNIVIPELCGFDIPVSQDDLAEEYLAELQKISYCIADLNKTKVELEKRVSALLEHGDSGQATYYKGRFKVTINGGYNYNLNKEEYEIIKDHIPACFDPVRKRMAYDLNKSVLRDIDNFGDEAVKALIFGRVVDNELVGGMITSSPKKVSVKISPRGGK
jgi:hypothetical protein